MSPLRPDVTHAEGVITLNVSAKVNSQRTHVQRELEPGEAFSLLRELAEALGDERHFRFVRRPTELEARSNAADRY